MRRCLGARANDRAHSEEPWGILQAMNMEVHSVKTRLSHTDGKGRPRMVDVTDKPVSHRTALAEGCIRLRPATVRLIAAHGIAKGNVLTTAELAGVQAAKQTANIIPLCHPLRLTHIKVEARLARPGVVVTAAVKCTDKTGAEMEALTATTAALLTVYDMCKAVDKSMVISEVRLLEKTKTTIDG